MLLSVFVVLSFSFLISFLLYECTSPGFPFSYWGSICVVCSLGPLWIKLQSLKILDKMLCRRERERERKRREKRGNSGLLKWSKFLTWWLKKWSLFTDKALSYTLCSELSPLSSRAHSGLLKQGTAEASRWGEILPLTGERPTPELRGYGMGKEGQNKVSPHPWG